jgi:CheY-like chemotaxis protein
MIQQPADNTTGSIANPKQVFLIERNSDDIALARRAISHVGHAVHLEVLQTADALKETISSDNSCACPDLILIDLQLYSDARQSENVFGLVSWLRQSPRALHTPIVMISALNSEENIWRSYEAGANSVIAKPVAFTEYAAVLKEVCSYWLNLSVRPHCKDVRPPAQHIAKAIS